MTGLLCVLKSGEHLEDRNRQRQLAAIILKINVGWNALAVLNILSECKQQPYFWLWISGRIKEKPVGGTTRRGAVGAEHRGAEGDRGAEGAEGGGVYFFWF